MDYPFEDEGNVDEARKEFLPIIVSQASEIEKLIQLY
jgi:hypothetical protein